MNYKHVYMLIIEHAKSEQKLGLRKKENGEYYERHHILSKSLFPLWAKRKSNLVLLTAREHFFCHQLLTKLYPGKEMAYALYAFITRPNADYEITSREYERLKLEFSMFISNRNINNNYAKGHHWKLSDETKKNMSKARKGKPLSEKNKLSIKEYIDKNITGKTYEEIFGEEKAALIKEKMSSAKKGKTHKSKPQKEETKNRIRVSMKNRKAIKCIETNQIFPSIRTCANYFSIDNKKLSKLAQNGNGIKKKKGQFLGQALHFVLI